ncbi:Variant-specific surface protein [Giardia duodenalis]|uniref:Variant-specific surface protein n=1 Tax=Giardia intestinalis TaxID=5741 RepID=V6U955_GIAIN|nr:Variant-specific surface protein [Giardia intestinalis]
MKCSDEGVCLQCSTGKLTPTNQCVDKCEKLEGYFDGSDGNCAKCNDACKTCAGAASTQCLSCPAGKALKYTDETPANGGSCVDECKVNTGGCADCGATIGGSKYCSKCNDASQAPLNGNCAANTARTKFCTNASNGACTQCANGYFLLDGGCYQTSRQPGSQVCTAANNGQCQTCANGQQPASGVCPACPANCASCTGTDTKTCTKCLSGYYLDSGSVCRKCSEISGDILGVENCISCAPPTGNRGFVTCYVKTSGSSGGGDSTGGNNGSNFSTGMIVSISLTAVAVVGGLIGFLCWWFVCRTKK